MFIDQDLDTHDRAEGAIEAELAEIFGRLGASLPAPDPSRVKGRHNYAARIIVTIVTCGVYSSGGSTTCRWRATGICKATGRSRSSARRSCHLTIKMRL